MAERRKTCLQCRTYDLERSCCRLGKTNPRKKHEAQTVAELLGVQCLCVHNPFREPLILRMRFPDRRFVWADSDRARTSSKVEVEILDEG